MTAWTLHFAGGLTASQSAGYAIGYGANSFWNSRRYSFRAVGGLCDCSFIISLQFKFKSPMSCNHNGKERQLANYSSCDRQRSFLQIAKFLHTALKARLNQTIQALLSYSPARHNTYRIRNQFIEHCVVIIQSRYRGFIQRKRYRQFLPIYRRLR